MSHDDIVEAIRDILADHTSTHYESFGDSGNIELCEVNIDKAAIDIADYFIKCHGVTYQDYD